MALLGLAVEERTQEGCISARHQQQQIVPCGPCGPCGSVPTETPFRLAFVVTPVAGFFWYVELAIAVCKLS